MGRKCEKSRLEVVWNEKTEELRLEGEPVLRYTLSWPELRGGGAGGRWINRYYAHLAKSWQLRWRREVYWKACIALADCRACARPFTAWTGTLEGTVTLMENGLLSLCMEGEEIRGNGRPCRVKWGDVWKVREGTPLTPWEWFGGRRGIRKKAMAQVLEQGREKQGEGACFLDHNWEEKGRRTLSLEEYWLTGEGAQIAFPQSTIAPPAEGTPVFQICR